MSHHDHELHGHGSGDGFVTLADGTVRWGRFGAAGVLASHRDQQGEVWYFLARRSAFTHRGGTWAIPGGALDRGESPLDGALREFREEIGQVVGDHRVVDVHHDDHGGWSYWTLLLEVPERFEVRHGLGWETSDARWVRRSDLGHLELFDAFRATLQQLGVL